MIKPNDIPQSLLRDLQGIPGFNESAFIAAHQLSAPVSVRLNPAKDIGLFSAHEHIPWCPGGVYLSERPVFTLDPAFHAGAYYVQEASSMFLHHMLSGILVHTKGLRVLDLCAAPGGKSTLIASLLDPESLLISNEVIRTRAAILDENIARWGYMNTWVTGNDPRDFAKLPGYFDVIVVDAPCSGSGLWRKDARSIDEWSEANVQMCSERQQRILADVWPALKENGSVKGEGFFIAALQKKEEAGEMRPIRFKSAHDKKIQQQAGYLLQDNNVFFIPADKESYSAIRPSHEPDWHQLQKAVYLRRTGLKLGSATAKEWLPDHEVALSVDANKELPHINVGRDQALRFLKREDTGINDVAKGWNVIRYNGLGLGWVKALGNRMNNYLPKHWRIRMDIDV